MNRASVMYAAVGVSLSSRADVRDVRALDAAARARELAGEDRGDEDGLHREERERNEEVERKAAH